MYCNSESGIEEGLDRLYCNADSGSEEGLNRCNAIQKVKVRKDCTGCIITECGSVAGLDSCIESVVVTGQQKSQL